MLPDERSQPLTAKPRRVGAHDDDARPRADQGREILQQGSEVRLDLPRARAVTVRRWVQHDPVVAATSAPLAAHELAGVVERDLGQTLRQVEIVTP